MSSFSRGVIVGALAMFGIACLVTMARADTEGFPKDLVGIAKNNMGLPVFFSIYQDTKPEIKPGAHCTGNWHIVASQLPEPQPPLFGCWTFTAAREITVQWNNGKVVKYDAGVVQLADWFVTLYPIHAPPSDDKEPETGQPDTKL